MLSGFNPETIQNLEGAQQAIAALLNLVESLKQENHVFDKRKGYHLIIEKGTTLVNPSKK